MKFNLSFKLLKLKLSIRNKNAFLNFIEPKILFGPTYKFKPNTNDYDGEKRLPAWCDRILYKSSKRVEMQPLLYKSYPNIQISDHKPVAAIFNLHINEFFYY